MSKYDLNIVKIGDTYLLNPQTEESIHVSTVFMGVDYPTQLGQYETMIFGGQFDQHQWRYDSREEARKGHLAAVLLVESYLIKASTEKKEPTKSSSCAKERLPGPKPDLPIRSISFEDDK